MAPFTLNLPLQLKLISGVLGLLLQVDDAQERIDHDTQAALARVQGSSQSAS